MLLLHCKVYVLNESFTTEKLCIVKIRYVVICGGQDTKLLGSIWAEEYIEKYMMLSL